MFLHGLTGCIYAVYVVRGSRNKRLLVVALWLGRPVKQNLPICVPFFPWFYCITLLVVLGFKTCVVFAEALED